MDNNTTYIDNYITTRTHIREWNQYYPKVKEGKKPLPKKYHYFRKRLYSEKSTLFLFLSIRYDDEEDIFRLRINGSLRKWYFNGNTLEDLILPQYIDCMRKIAERVGITYTDMLGGRNTKIESGLTVALNAKFEDLLKCFIYYKDFERIAENDTTLYFRGKFYSFILYEKEIEINSKCRHNKSYEPIENTKSSLRFEVKVNSVSGVKFYKENANSVRKVIENWNLIVNRINESFMSIQFIDFMETEIEFEKITFSQLKKYFIIIGMKSIGLQSTFEKFKKVRNGTNITKNRDEIFSLLRSHSSPKTKLREELLTEIEKKINSLLYNKLNITSNSNNLLIYE